MNRYAGEIRINPVPVLRNDDFNNDGRIQDILAILDEALQLNASISERISRLRAFMESSGFSEATFYFSEGGYIAVNGISDEQLLAMKAKGLIDLFDFATDREWVKKYGHLFGLVWENGRAVSAN